MKLAGFERVHTGYAVEEKMIEGTGSLVLAGHMLIQRHHTVEVPADSSRLKKVTSGIDSGVVVVVVKEKDCH